MGSVAASASRAVAGRAAQLGGEKDGHWGEKAIIRVRLPIATQPPTRHLPGPANYGDLKGGPSPTFVLYSSDGCHYDRNHEEAGGDENEVMYVKHLAPGLVGNEQTPAPLPSPSNKMACG